MFNFILNVKKTDADLYFIKFMFILNAEKINVNLYFNKPLKSFLMCRNKNSIFFPTDSLISLSKLYISFSSSFDYNRAI